jgi:hypothetical protein
LAFDRASPDTRTLDGVATSARGQVMVRAIVAGLWPSPSNSARPGRHHYDRHRIQVSPRFLAAGARSVDRAIRRRQGAELFAQVLTVGTDTRLARFHAREDGLAAANLPPAAGTNSAGFRRIDVEFTPDMSEFFRVRQASIRHHGAPPSPPR